MSNKFMNIFFEKWGYPKDRWHLRTWTVIVLFVTGVVAFVFAVGFVGVGVDRYFSQQSCKARAELIGTEEYSWQDFTFFDYGCYNVSEKGTTSDNYQRVLIEAD
jgi:hypothetical protein